jgi:hypothetical protein
LGRTLPISTFALNHDWPTFSWLSARTGYTRELEQDIAGRNLREAWFLGARAELTERLSVDFSLGLGRNERNGVPESNRNLSGGLVWRMDPDWTLAADWIDNRIDLQAADPMQSRLPFERDRRWSVTLRHEASGGQPYARLGAGGPRAGSGDIEGLVFFDANNDGRQQPSERGAAGVLVFLDDRYTQSTDSDGRFRFLNVAVGLRRLKVAQDQLPLPWVMRGEQALTLRVGVRAVERAEIALSKMSPD